MQNIRKNNSIIIGSLIWNGSIFYFSSLELFFYFFKVVKKAAVGWNAVTVFVDSKVVERLPFKVFTCWHQWYLHTEFWLDVMYIYLYTEMWLACSFISAPYLKQKCICFATQVLIWMHLLRKLFSGLLLRLYIKSSDL